MINKIQLQLKDRGRFIVTVDEKQYHGKFNMNAVERFLDLKTIPGMFVLNEMFRLGMRPTEYAEFIICGIEELDKHHGLKVDDVKEWFDAMGGFGSLDVIKLISFGMKTFTRLPAQSLEQLKLSEEEKKIFGLTTVLNGGDTNAGGQGSEDKNTETAP